MNLKLHYKCGGNRNALYKLLLVMKLIIILLTTAILQVSAYTYAQKVTLKKTNAPFEQIINEIRNQTGYDFFYSNDLLRLANPISINVNNATLEDALKQCFSNQPLTYTIAKEEKAVVVKEKQPSFLDKVVHALTFPIDVSGVVLDEKGAPLVGATVKVKGVNQTTTTDAQGRFSLTNVDDMAVLIITFIGYTPKEVTAKAALSVSLEVQPSELQEVVVAYGKTTQQALTGAVTVVKGEQFQNLPNRSFDKSLQGLVPGLQITNGTGQPGGGMSNIVLRGIATSGDASAGQTVRNPLFVIDGIPVSQDLSQLTIGINVTPISNPLAQLNPSDIETISVLKDAAAIALYGSKASNGVILITTKRGKTGKTIFNFRHQTDVSGRLSGGLNVLNQQDYLGLLYATYKSANPTLWTDQAILTDLKAKFPTKADGSFYPAPDWNAELYNENAKTYATEFSMSGGSEKSNFYLNLEYTKQNGIVKSTGYDRKSLRFNFENKPTDALKLGTNTTLSYNLQDYANVAEAADYYGAGMVISPLIPNRLEDGSYKLTNPFGTSFFFINPVAQQEYNLNRNTAYRGLTNLYGDIKFLKNFNFRSNLGADFSLTELKQKIDPRFYKSLTSAGRPKISEQDSRLGNFINTNTLTFNRNISEGQTFSLLLGQEAQIMTSKILRADATGSAATLPYYDQISSPGYTMSAINGNTVRQTLLSFFGQANYGFMDKYFVSASVRRDGASRFGDQQRWGNYWSTGLGWIVSNESWLKENTPWLNYLKLRGSLGAAGNSAAVGALTRFDRLYLYRYNSGIAVGSQSSPGNPDIKWEQTATWDAGLEVRMFNERISLTADLYSRKTTDLIYTEQLASITGYGTVLSNIGDMKNRGLELSLSTKIVRTKNLRWDFGANWSTNANKLVKANIPLTVSTGNIANEEGRNYNSFYMPVWAGVNPADGKPQWLDANGLPTSTYNSAKKEFVGKPQPDGFGAITSSLGFNNVELFVQGYYQYGSKIYNSALASTFLNDGISPYANQSVGALTYWQKPGDIAVNPRRLLNNTDGGNRASTRYLFNGDYFRLQNVTLSYNFTKETLTRLHLSALRLYVQGQNLLIITKYSGSDPDNITVGGNTSGFAYPIPRTFSFGLNLNFR